MALKHLLKLWPAELLLQLVKIILPHTSKSSPLRHFYFCWFCFIHCDALSATNCFARNPQRNKSFHCGLAVPARRGRDATSLDTDAGYYDTRGSVNSRLGIDSKNKLAVWQKLSVWTQPLILCIANALDIIVFFVYHLCEKHKSIRYTFNHSAHNVLHCMCCCKC